MVYVELWRQYAELHDLSVLGFRLMSNHVHLVVTPHSKEGLALAMKQTHGRYASYGNVRQASDNGVSLICPIFRRGRCTIASYAATGTMLVA